VLLRDDDIEGWAVSTLRSSQPRRPSNSKTRTGILDRCSEARAALRASRNETTEKQIAVTDTTSAATFMRCSLRRAKPYG